MYDDLPKSTSIRSVPAEIRDTLVVIFSALPDSMGAGLSTIKVSPEDKSCNICFTLLSSFH
jgi:hypothetical protein